jgi:hypothetical protein
MLREAITTEERTLAIFMCEDQLDFNTEDHSDKVEDLSKKVDRSRIGGVK